MVKCMVFMHRWCCRDHANYCMSKLQFDKYALLSRKGFCWDNALLSSNCFRCKYAPFGVCLVQIFTQTFRTRLRFCAAIWTKNRRRQHCLELFRWDLLCDLTDTFRGRNSQKSCMSFCTIWSLAFLFPSSWYQCTIVHILRQTFPISRNNFNKFLPKTLSLMHFLFDEFRSYLKWKNLREVFNRKHGNVKR